MLRIGCTGGIGSGKSTVCAALFAKRAAVIDADAIERAASAPGGAAFAAIVERFGPTYLASDGSIDRSKLGRYVFSNADALKQLEAIVHPIAHREINRILDELEEQATTPVVVVDGALLVETNARARYRLDGMLVVDASEELCVERLVAYRDLSEEDARRRIAAQASQATRLLAADFVIVNVGTLDELTEMANEAWRWIERLRDEKEEAAS